MDKRTARFFQEHVTSFTSALRQLESRVPPGGEPNSDELSRELADCIKRSLAKCAELESEWTEDAASLKAAQQAYREAIWPWFGQSWFMCRALEKPRGYPGDYEMLVAIYDGMTKSLGLGGYLDRYFLATDLARAVRGRMRAVTDFLLQELGHRIGDVTILNVACGPCREFTHRFDVRHERAIRLIGVDSDALALEYARSVVAPLVANKIQTEFVQHNALRMISARHNVQKFGRPDILYSVGLCDYLSDRVLVPMLKAWRESVSEGGVVYVAFKDSQRYDPTEYQWPVDWFFLQRTESECRELFAAAGYDMGRLQMQRDQTGVILNYAGYISSQRTFRVDEATEAVRPPRIVTSAEPVEEPTEHSW